MDLPTLPTLGARASGVLLHLTSLPGPHGSGDLGPEAHRFVDLLVDAEQSFWQMLPVGPPGYGNSPYSAQSALAGNPALIALEPLVERGLLDGGTIERIEDGDRVDFARTTALREGHLRAAFAAYRARGDGGALGRFAKREASWLDDYALFRALKRANGDVQWTLWPAAQRDREPKELARARRELAEEIDLERFLQLVFEEQWQALRAACEARGVALIGDLPIFVAHDSADVWSQRDMFRLGEDGEPTHVSGVPPDYFSTTGQRWGNPLYRWSKMAEGGYAWWIARLRKTLARFHVVRLDHFIGFQRYWSIPASCPTAIEGRWLKGPGAPFFEAAEAALGPLPLIAEDLGLVTAKVKQLRDRFRLPGIKVLQFAFGADPSAPDFLPHNYRRRAVVYTGTHDNDTVVGWFEDAGGGERTAEQAAVERATALAYFGTSGGEVHWDAIRTALASVADTSIFPLQDVLGLGSEARMNRPGRGDGNWAWRLTPGALGRETIERLRALTRTYGRGRGAPAGRGVGARSKE